MNELQDCKIVRHDLENTEMEKKTPTYPRNYATGNLKSSYYITCGLTMSDKLKYHINQQNISHRQFTRTNIVYHNNFYPFR